MNSKLQLQSATGRLCVEFVWTHDRFAHRVFDLEGRSLESLEGTPEDVWPSSPPIQQLSLEEIDGKSVLLGVGAAGKGHWSICVVPDSAGEGDGIKFELACRCRIEPTDLMSSYRQESPGLKIEPTSGVMSIEAVGPRVRPSHDSPSVTRQWAYRIT